MPADATFISWRSLWLDRIRLFWSLGTVTIDKKHYQEDTH